MLKKASTRVKYHNRTKVLLCYLLAWGLALLLPYLGLAFIYPYKLAGSAPELAQSLLNLHLTLPGLSEDALAATALTAGMAQGALTAALTARDLVWRYVVGGMVGLAAVLSLVWQLLWRARFMRPRQAAKSALKAVTGYRWAMAGIWGLNAVLALVLYLIGVRWIGGKTVWDYMVYFSGFVLVPVAAWICFRLAAPPAISGRHGFFRRL